MKLNTFKNIIIILIFSFLLTPAGAFASNFENFSGLNDTAEKNYDLSKNNIPLTVGNIVSYVLSFLGIIFLCIIVISYVIMSTAGGDEEKVKKSKLWLKNAIIALFIIMAAYLFSIVLIKFWTMGILDS